MFHFFFRVFGIELTIQMGLEMAFTLSFEGETMLSFPTSTAFASLRCVSRGWAFIGDRPYNILVVQTWCKNVCFNAHEQIFWLWWIVNDKHPWCRLSYGWQPQLYSSPIFWLDSPRLKTFSKIGKSKVRRQMLH